MKKRVAVLFMTHLWNDALMRKFERMRSEIGDIADVFILMQKSDAVEKAVRSVNTLRRSLSVFDPETLPQELGYPYAFNDTMVPGSTHFPLLHFSLRTNYRYYYLIEYDVDFSGNWGELIAATLKGLPDFASLHHYAAAQKPEWVWWRHFQPGRSDFGWATDAQNLKRSFNPIYCLSHRAARIVHAAHLDGWRGHHELLLPTVLAHRGCRLVDLQKKGGFCIGSEQDRLREEPVMELSTVRWKPEVTMQEFAMRSNGRTLFHPVKETWYFDGTQLVSL